MLGVGGVGFSLEFVYNIGIDSGDACCALGLEERWRRSQEEAGTGW